MMNPEAIHLTLRNAFRAAASVQDSEAAWQNVDFKRTVGQRYFQEVFEHAAPERVTFASNPQVEVRGIYLIFWNDVSNRGNAAIRADVEEVLAQFEDTWAVTLDDGWTVRIDGAQMPFAGRITPGVVEAAWSTCEIEINWIARGRARAVA